MPILRSYAPGLLARCDHEAKRAEGIVADALRHYMFKDSADAGEKAQEAAAWFGNAKEFLSHGHPVRREHAREHNIKIRDLEEDSELQDAVLSVHHAVLIGMANLPIAKLIENHKERLWVITGAQQIGMMLPLELPGGPPGPGTPPPDGSPPLGG
jgi:hypothetical protein